MNKYEIVGVVGEGAYVQLNTALVPSYSLLLVNSGFKHATCYYNKLDGVALASTLCRNLSNFVSVGKKHCCLMLLRGGKAQLVARLTRNRS